LPEQVCYCGTKMVEMQVCKYQCKNCVPGTTILLGDNKQIAILRPGDMCVGVTGHVRVNEKYQRPYEGEIVKIRTAGLLNIETTPEHPILVVRSKVRQHRTVSLSEPEWKQAKDILPKRRWRDGDYLVMPRVVGCVSINVLDLGQFTNEHGRRTAGFRKTPLVFPIDESSAWLLGMYVAEGCSSATGILFSLSREESDLHQRIVNIGQLLGYSPFVSNVPTGTIVGISSRLLGRAFPVWCGSRAPNKRIPDFILLHENIAIVRAFLHGYLQGDGSIDRKRSRASTVSPVLSMQLQLLCARLGMTVNVRKISDPGEGFIQGRRVRLHEKYGLTVYPHSRQMRVLDDKILVPVKKVETSPFKGKVYNIATADGTYLASNAVVHNCGMVWDCEDVLGLPK